MRRRDSHILFGAIVVSLSLLPAALAFLGMLKPIDLSQSPNSGRYLYGLLEWIAIGVAVSIVVLGALQLITNSDPTVGVITIATYLCVCVGVTQMALLELFGNFSQDAHLIPLARATARTFTATALLLGGTYLLRSSRSWTPTPGFLAAGTLLGFAAGAALYLFAVYADSPARPALPAALEIVTLLLLGVAGTVVFPVLYRRQRDTLSLALWLCVAPQLAAELHMLLGANALFDDHFVAAQALNVATYLILASGYAATSVTTQRNLKQEVQQRFVAAQELERDNLELTQRNAEMEQFAYTVSHDLKTPVVTILGFSRHVLQRLREADANNLPIEQMARVERAAERMSQLIDDLLDLGRAGRFSGNPEDVDLEQIAQEVRQQLTENHVPPVVVQIEHSLPTLRVHRDPIRQVFENLVSNALRHGQDSTKSPRLLIGHRPEPGYQVVFVEDNGPGIDPMHHKRIFEMFQSIQKEQTGSGIGLAIVRRIVELHGGRIDVKSTLGEGARFELRFPDTLLVNRDSERE